MSIPFYSNLDLKNNKIENVGTPTGNNDGVNKIYTDNAIADLHAEITGEIEAEVLDINSKINEVDNKIDDLDNGLNNRISTVVQPILENNIIDDTNSTNIDKSLSANQGRILKERIDEVRNSITPNVYYEEPRQVGVYNDIALYRLIILGDITTTPNFNDVIRIVASDVVEPGTTYEYEVINAYGSFTTNYDVLHESIDIPKTYKMLQADCLSAVNLTKAYIYLGNVDISNNEIHTWFKFGSDFQGIFNSNPELLPIKYRIIIEFTRQEITS